METQKSVSMDLYFQTKDIFKRTQILKQLVCDMPIDAKEFFLKAFKRERHLDMKLCAIRGYAAYATEDEISGLMNKLLELLIKRNDIVPYNYEEYESMRSVFLMPYLLEHYNYACFHVFNEQLEKQYNNMPDCFKNIFTLDVKGNLQQIRNPAEVKQSLELFFKKVL